MIVRPDTAACLVAPRSEGASYWGRWCKERTAAESIYAPQMIVERYGTAVQPLMGTYWFLALVLFLIYTEWAK